MEVRLFDSAVVDGHALMQYAGKTIEDCALHIGFSRRWRDNNPAVDCDPHFVHADLASVTLERDFHRSRTKRVRALGDRDTERAAVRTFGLMVAHLRQ